MKKILAFMAMLYLLQGDVAGQTPNSLGHPSPNNSFLGEIFGVSGSEKVDVDAYTGTLVINIPICDLSSKELSVPVSLNYTGGRGIRIQDYATIAGLGWQLNAGAISPGL